MTEAEWYVKKPIPIQAIQFTGENFKEIQDWTGTWIVEGLDEREHFVPVEEQWPYPPEGIVAVVYDELHSTWVGVKERDYILRGIQGEYYPCDEEVFNASYEKADV